MGMLTGILKAATRGWAGGSRTWTPAEVRELIRADRVDEAEAASSALSPKLANREAETACLLGEIAFQRRQDDAAMAHFRAALRIDPGLRAAHHGLSLVLAERGVFDDAVRHAQFAAGTEGGEGRCLAQVGYCHLRLGNMHMAESALRRASLAMADDPHVWNNLGLVMRAKGDLHEARRLFELALKIRPGLQTAQGNLALVDAEISEGAIPLALDGPDSSSLRPPLPLDLPAGLSAVMALERAGELQRAIDQCEAMTLEHADDELAAVILSQLYERVGDQESAIDALKAHLANHPSAVSAGAALGMVLLRAHSFRLAEPWLRRAAEQAPDHLDNWMALGQCLSRQERYAEANPVLERAAAMAPGQLRVTVALAANLSNECRYEEALEMLEGLGELKQRISGHGSVLGFLGRYDEALALATKAVERQPNDPSLRFQRAQLHLLLENFGPGWDDYAYRGLNDSKDFRMLPFPLWRGEGLEGKRIIVLAEQGLGDQVMFASCLPDLMALRPAEVVLEAHRRVAKTLARSFPDCRVVPSAQNATLDWLKEFPDADCFVPLPDLAVQFRRTREAFPQHAGYLRPDPLRVAHWRAQLEATGPGPYIGVSWKGGTERTRTSLRSLAPEDLLPLAAAQPDASWVCLQYGPVGPEVERMATSAMPLVYWPESISDLDEFAALVSALDLVITVCNTTVHYAGALGKPVWVLCPQVPEWRYGHASTSLPWYPSSRALRQVERGDWSGPLTAACRALSHWPPADPVQGGGSAA